MARNPKTLKANMSLFLIVSLTKRLLKHKFLNKSLNSYKLPLMVLMSAFLRMDKLEVGKPLQCKEIVPINSNQLDLFQEAHHSSFPKLRNIKKKAGMCNWMFL